MTILRYLLFAMGAGLMAGAFIILAWDLYEVQRARKRTTEGPLPPFRFRWALAGRLAALSIVPWLAGSSIALVPSGTAGVRINQFTGTRPGTLYPGVHWVAPGGAPPEPACICRRPP